MQAIFAWGRLPRSEYAIDRLLGEICVLRAILNGLCLGCTNRKYKHHTHTKDHPCICRMIKPRVYKNVHHHRRQVGCQYAVSDPWLECHSRACHAWDAQLHVLGLRKHMLWRWPTFTWRFASDTGRIHGVSQGQPPGKWRPGAGQGDRSTWRGPCACTSTHPSFLLRTTEDPCYIGSKTTIGSPRICQSRLVAGSCPPKRARARSAQVKKSLESGLFFSKKTKKKLPGGKFWPKCIQGLSVCPEILHSWIDGLKASVATYNVHASLQYT